LKNHLRLLIEYVKISLASAMEYKTSFITQTITMAINDTVWIIFWIIFFNKFNQVNGWTVQDMFMLYAVVTFSYGLAGVFFGNRNKIAEVIAEGKLDFYLSLPKNELFHVLISRSSWFSMGDIVFGLIMGIISFSWWQWPLFFVLSLMSMSIIISFGTLAGSLAFFMGNAEESSRNLYMGLISFSTYPLAVFHGAARIILLTIIPAGFVSGIPVELLKNFNWKWFILSFIFSLVFLTISIIVFKIGLRKYESGNNMNVRV